jgi:hypothetical protein
MLPGFNEHSAQPVEKHVGGRRPQNRCLGCILARIWAVPLVVSGIPSRCGDFLSKRGWVTFPVSSTRRAGLLFLATSHQTTLFETCVAGLTGVELLSLCLSTSSAKVRR